MKKFMLRVMPIVLVALVVLAGPVFGAFDQNIVDNIMNQQATGNTVKNTANGIWGTVLTVLRILAVAAIVFAGVRYMFASADQKADIKKGMIYLVLGAVLVFAASTVVSLIINTAEEVL